MNNFHQNIISKRFLEVLDELIDKQIVDNVADFCKRIGYKTQSMSQIRHGKRDVTIELISKILTEYNGNPIYILSGKGSRILESYSMPLVEEPLAEYKTSLANAARIHDLQKLLESKEEIITLLKNEISRLNQVGR